jgi:DNA adenine methylase
VWWAQVDVATRDREPAGVHPPAEVVPRPVLKWAGGKQQLVGRLLRLAPGSIERYIEPFAGGAALFFALRPERAILSDANPELMHFYQVLAHQPEALIDRLQRLAADERTYYEMRALDPAALPDVERAARTLYLNRTCYNGLYRVNRRGQFNVPYGRYPNPRLYNADALRAASRALDRAELLCADYRVVLREHARPGDFVYLDPPYLPVSTSADFKRYTKEQFHQEDHVDLAAEVRRLHELGCHVLVTHSNHPLIHELYGGFDLEVVPTRRSINQDGRRRSGEDVILSVPPKRRVRLMAVPPPLPDQVARFPSTRFMGSKQNLLPAIAGIADHFRFRSALDLFSGTGVVGYLFKAMGKRVLSNDHMAFCAAFAKALIENGTVRLEAPDLEVLLDRAVETDGFISSTFGGLYFAPDDDAFLDRVRANLRRVGDPAKRALATSALVRAVLKKRPRGIFTFTGDRYDDGRRDLRLTLAEQFCAAVEQMNAAVFDNGEHNVARWGDALTTPQTADLVYIDPPYYSPLSDNEYVRRYHFVEGLARDWTGVEIQWHTKTRKFKGYPTPFSSRAGAHAAFDRLFRKFRDSILLVSYSSNSLPTRDEIGALLARHKRHVEVVSVDHRYSFGTQSFRTGRDRNIVQEYLFVGY